MKKSMTYVTSCTNNNYFGFLITFFFKRKTAIAKKKMFFLLCSFLPLPYLFHPSYLPFIFIQYFSPLFSLPLSLSPPFLSLHSVPVFSLFIFTFESHHHFPFSCTLFPSTLEFPLSYTSHTPCCTLILWFSPFFLACPFHSAFHSSIFLLLSIFSHLHWDTRSSGSNSLFPSSPCSFSFEHFVTILHSSLSPFCPQILPLSFPLSLPAHSSLTMSVSLKYVSYTLSTSSCSFLDIPRHSIQGDFIIGVKNFDIVFMK
jgi:hypothetical protein